MTMTTNQVIAAQASWGNGVAAIGKAQDPQAAAKRFVDDFYAYDIGKVLFKPTRAKEVPFRATKEAAVSYFVTGMIPEDKGFCLVPYAAWIDTVRFENAGIIINDDSALAMGHYYFSTTEGKESKVEYSFAYVKDQHGKLKINLHHSALPYNGE